MTNKVLKNRIFLILTAITLVSLSCSLNSAEVPRLVVLIAVDQMKYDFTERFYDLYEGGLKMLIDGGVNFTNTHQAHAYTTTGSGHAAIYTGSYPRTNGIIGNYWYNRNFQKSEYSVEDENSPPLSGRGRSVSYKNVLVSGIGDWLKSKYSNSQVFSIGGKNRSAITMGGENPDGVYWFDSGTGDFVTSSSYMKEYPEWMSEFNKSDHFDSYFDSKWNRLLSNSDIYEKYSREDDFPQEGVDGQRTFPHYLPKKDGYAAEPYDIHWEFPWMDEVTLNLAETIIAEEKLGNDENPDYLAVCLSVADGIGHTYGPYSQEVMDYFLRLDFMLEKFFKFLNNQIGMENVLIVLTSDHGTAMMPEYAVEMGLNAERFGREMGTLETEIESFCESRWGTGDYIERISNSSIYNNLKTLREKGIGEIEFNSDIKSFLTEFQWISKVYSKHDLMDDSALDYEGQLWQNQFHLERSGDLMLVFKEHYVYRYPYGTGHGTPYGYDTHVPLIFLGKYMDGRKYNEYVETVDIAPTIAKRLNLYIPDNVDGKAIPL